MAVEGEEPVLVLTAAYTQLQYSRAAFHVTLSTLPRLFLIFTTNIIIITTKFMT
jgi:hypothetical protein